MRVLSTVEREWLYPRFTLRVGLNRVPPSPLLRQKIEALCAAGLVSLVDDESVASGLADAPADLPSSKTEDHLPAPEDTFADPVGGTDGDDVATEGTLDPSPLPVTTSSPAAHTHSDARRVKRRRRH